MARKLKQYHLRFRDGKRIEDHWVYDYSIKKVKNRFKDDSSIISIKLVKHARHKKTR